MDKTKLLTIAVIGLLLLNFGILAKMMMQHPPRPEGGPNGGPHHGPGQGGPKMIIIERLNFDEAQQKQYEVLIQEHRHSMDSLNDESLKMKNELYSLLKENNDPKLSDAIIIQIAENQKQIEMVNFDHFKKIRSICKQEQIPAFNNLLGELTKLFSPEGPPHGPNGRK